jgi:hypothetical protein
MVATVDAVVLGEVVRSEPGHLVGDSEDPVAKTKETVRVERVLFGEVEEMAEGGVWLQQIVWGPPGSTFNDVPNAEVGDRAILFLQGLCDPGEPPVYYRINSQGIFFIEGGEVRDTSRDDAVSKRNEQNSVGQLQRDIAAAAERARSGEVKPAPITPNSKPGDYDEVPPEQRPPCDGNS